MKEKKVIDEIVERAEDYESGMGEYAQGITDATDLFLIKAPPRKSKTFSNPRQTEFYRAATAVGTMSFRMMTAADPNYNAFPVDHDPDFTKLDTIKHTWAAQLKYANYRPNLLRACLYAPVYGTVICQEDYRIIGVSAYGRRIPVTVLMPRVMDQVMFDRAATSFDDADWVSTSDLTSSVALMRLAGEVKTLNAPWNEKAIKAAADDKEDPNSINPYVLNRIQRYGYSIEEAARKRKEILMFYGKLDCMNDGIEYVAALVNRKFLVRFHANTFQHGRRPFRVAKWVDFGNIATGYGMGQLFSRAHRTLDGNRQRTIDAAAMDSYGMWQRKKDSVDNKDMVIGPMRVVDVENIGDLARLPGNQSGITGQMALDEVLKQEFRAATHASDTLQAIADSATTTATQAALSQNEGLRAVGIHAEMLSHPLVREHIENLHWNNAQNIRAPFNINRAGVSHTVYPSDLRMDLDIEAKIVTDKDFSPAQIDKLIQTLQILVSTKSQHPDQMDISIKPLVKKIAYFLEVNPDEVILNPTRAPAVPGLGVGDLSGLAGAMAAGGGMAAGPSTVPTPIGDVMASA